MPKNTVRFMKTGPRRIHAGRDGVVEVESESQVFEIEDHEMGRCGVEGVDFEFVRPARDQDDGALKVESDAENKLAPGAVEAKFDEQAVQVSVETDAPETDDGQTGKPKRGRKG